MMFDLRKIFNLRKIFAVPKHFLKWKNYCNVKKSVRFFQISWPSYITKKFTILAFNVVESRLELTVLFMLCNSPSSLYSRCLQQQQNWSTQSFSMPVSEKLSPFSQGSLTERSKKHMTQYSSTRLSFVPLCSTLGAAFSVIYIYERVTLYRLQGRNILFLFLLFFPIIFF